MISRRSVRAAVAVALGTGLLAIGCSSEPSGGFVPVDAGADAGPCEIDADCNVGVCDPVAHQCVECVADDDCSPGASCEDNVCAQAAQCTTSLDCVDAGAGGVCDPSLGQCVECLGAWDCPPDHDCDDTRRCVPSGDCVNSLDCPDGQVCDEPRGRCVECITDGDCPLDDKCAGSVCVPACDSDNDCTPVGLLCDKSAGYCVECIDSSDCAIDRFCRGGACLADLCEGGNSKCDGNGVATCESNGEGWATTVPCSFNQTCVSTGAIAGCQNQICTPSTISCETGTDNVVECSDDGLTSTLVEDCSVSGEICVAGACKPQICTPSALFCSGDSLMQCNSTGDSTSEIQYCEPTYYYCNEVDQQCSLDQCYVGDDYCDANVPQVCRADGSGYDAGTDCSTTSQTCLNGACQTLLCTPYDVYCKNGNVWLCAVDGLSESEYDTCTPAEYCVDGVYTCQADVCTAGAPTCSGNLLTTCKTDGSGPETGGTDCGSQVCYNGSCQTLACTPNAYFCQSSDVYRCAANGLSSTLYDDCLASEFCTDGDLSCNAQVCTPNAAMCSGTFATTCKPDGSGAASGGTDCSLTSKVCYNGQCYTPVCTPNAYFCLTGDVHRCAANGLSDTLYDDCTAAEFCTDGDLSCNLQLCTPNQPSCNGASATTCNTDGSGYTGASTDCTATGKVCWQGLCQTPVCTANAYFCQTGDVYRCAANSLSSSLYDDCTAAEFCTDADSTCNPQICTPNQPACNGSTATVCNTDGSGYQAGGTNCAPQYCVGGACSATLFVENFEDGDYAGWSTGTGTYTRTVVTTTAANGTGYSLQLTKGGTLSGSYDGIYRTFTSIQPLAISWWSRAGQTNLGAAYFVMFPTSSASNALFTHSFSSAGQITLTHSAGSVTQAYVANTWYHFEIKNINWTNRTFDYYVDGVLRGVALTFSGSGTLIGRLDLYDFNALAVGGFDEIVLG